MAIKQRLLKKLERIAAGLGTPSFARNQQLIKGSARRLAAARDLCSEGIASARYAVHGEIYDTLLLALTQNDVLSQAGTLALCRELMQHLISLTQQEKHFKQEIFGQRVAVFLYLPHWRQAPFRTVPSGSFHGI